MSHFQGLPTTPSAPSLDDEEDQHQHQHQPAYGAPSFQQGGAPALFPSAQPANGQWTSTSTSHTSFAQHGAAMNMQAPPPIPIQTSMQGYPPMPAQPSMQAPPPMPGQSSMQGYPPQGYAAAMQAPPPMLGASGAASHAQWSTQSLLHGGFEPVTPMTAPLVAPMMPGVGAVSGSASGSMLPAIPASVVDLHFRCKGLKTSDVFSESDPFIVVYLEEAQHAWRELGRTETVVNSANPTFTTVIEVDYFFEEVQRIRLEIFDRDDKSEKLSKHDFLGCVEFTMGNLMSAQGHSLVLALLQSAKRRTRGISGHVFIDAEEAALCGDMIDVQFAAVKVDNKDGLFGKSDPFLNLYRLKDERSDPQRADSWMHVWRSTPVLNNLSPIWPKTTLSVRTLCNGDLSRLLKFECMDWEDSGRHQFIGSTTMTAAELVAGERRSMDLINAERQRRKGKRYTNSGLLKVVSLTSYKQHTFAEYLRGGCEISLIVGIDFTASNGTPTDPCSLHYVGSAHYGQLNDYQAAISSTGAILEAYDHDKHFPVYGFGALVNGQTNHCFPLNFDPTNPEVERVAGILRVYQESFQFLQLHGPTYFAPLVTQAAAIAHRFSQGHALKYFVLLIITDGEIMDMDATIEAIVAASQLPLSIVIVGVGNADFSSMDRLDSDNKVLVARSGRKAARDIVQFVPFNRYRGNPGRLAKETLAEIPLQLTQHFRSRGIAPHPPLERLHSDAQLASATAAADAIYQRMQV